MENESYEQGGMNRRDFIKTTGLGAGALAVSPALLAACTSGTSSSNKKSIHISNWPTYIKQSLIADFEKESGIKVEYTEDINDNNEYFAKIQPVLNKDKSINRDGFVLTDWMASRVINQLKWTQPLDNEKFTNKKNLLPALATPSFDKTRKYSVPWASGIAGFAYNISKTGKEIRTWDEFLAVSGTTTVLAEMRDTLGILMMSDGVEIEKVTIKQIESAFKSLQKSLNDGKIQGVNGNDYIGDLSNGNLVACVAWSGDVAQTARDNPDVRFAVPDSGGTLWSDNFMIPISSDKPAQATEFINYFYDPKVSAKWVEEVQYISPVAGVADELTKLGGDAAKLVDDPLVVPTDEILAKLQIFGSLSEKDEEKFDELTADIVGAG